MVGFQGFLDGLGGLGCFKVVWDGLSLVVFEVFLADTGVPEALKKSVCTRFLGVFGDF